MGGGGVAEGDEFADHFALVVHGGTGFMIGDLVAYIR